METKAKLAIEIAETNLNENPSANICLQDAKRCYNNQNYYYAILRSIQSVMYSKSIFSPQFATVKSYMPTLPA